ncbi:MAG: hypothetical protein HRT77_17285 [Halioglobus sp.]|nr:hypothetical protein [Halioglobus sp.]
MRDVSKARAFEFGPLTRGTYIALIALLPVVPFIDSAWVVPYGLLLVFLGCGARPVLQHSGAYHAWTSLENSLLQRWDRKYLARRRRDIDRRVRDDRYRKMRYRDPRLPKRW